MSKKPKWEKCPVCEGRGTVPFNPKAQMDHMISTGPYTCPHCHGARIINRKTGQPPAAQAIPASLTGEELAAFAEKYKRKPGEPHIQYRKDPLEGIQPLLSVFGKSEEVVKDLPAQPICNMGPARSFIISQLKSLWLGTYTKDERSNINIFHEGYDRTILENQWVVFTTEGLKVNIYALTEEQYKERFKP